MRVCDVCKCCGSVTCVCVHVRAACVRHHPWLCSNLWCPSHVFVCVYVFVCAYMRARVCVCMCLFVCVCAWVCVRMPVCVRACTRARGLASHMHVCVCAPCACACALCLHMCVSALCLHASCLCVHCVCMRVCALYCVRTLRACVWRARAQRSCSFCRARCPAAHTTSSCAASGREYVAAHVCHVPCVLLAMCAARRVWTVLQLSAVSCSRAACAARLAHAQALLCMLCGRQLRQPACAARYK